MQHKQQRALISQMSFFSFLELKRINKHSYHLINNKWLIISTSNFNTAAYVKQEVLVKMC